MEPNTFGIRKANKDNDNIQIGKNLDIDAASTEKNLKHKTP